MLHLISTRFKIDIVTPTGAPAIIEEWAMPRDDSNVIKLFRDYADAFANPDSLENFVTNSMIDDAGYVARFLPEGHGPCSGCQTTKTSARSCDGRIGAVSSLWHFVMVRRHCLQLIIKTLLFKRATRSRLSLTLLIKTPQPSDTCPATCPGNSVKS